MENQIPDPKLRAQIAAKIKAMAESNEYQIFLDTPFEKMKLYHEDSHELTDSIKTGAVIFCIKDTQALSHTFFLF